MNTTTLKLLCHPLTHEPLELVSENLLRGVSSGDSFSINADIPMLVPEDDCAGANQKYQKMYDRIAVVYDLGEKLYGWWKGLGHGEMRQPFLKDVVVRPGNKVLEVSVGTGANIWLLPNDAEYYGLDISWKMLRRCQRNAKKLKREIELIQGSAEHLPFRDDSFDSVLHVGGINFFNDKARAIREMIRVAKPGTRIMIADEEEEVVKSNDERNPLTRKYFQGRTESVSAPFDLVPTEIHDVRLEPALEGKAYVLNFTKA
jgi:ubiquinone/menaquinone biosynthesis C-methylase UbiE